MKGIMKNRAYMVVPLLISLMILSCDLFQLQPAERDNSLDPSSGSFSLPQRSWETPILLETDDSGDANYPQVAFDSAGNAMAVWQQSGNILANRYTATGWGTPQVIDSAAGSADRPQVAFDPEGNAMAVWYQSDSGYNSVYANRYTAGSGWGTAEKIETTDSGDADKPQVAVDSDGNAIAVWHQTDGSVFSIWANSYTVGSGWDTPTLLETDDSGDAYDAQVAFDPEGNAIVVWEQFDGSYYSIWTNRYTVDTGWGTAERIETNDGDTWNPQAAIDPAGNAIAVWSQSNGIVSTIRANIYTASVGWGEAEEIGTDVGDAWLPQVAVDSYGNAVAVWRQDDGGRYDIWSNRYIAGTGWGTPGKIETDDSGHAGDPQVAVDIYGNAIAVWWQENSVRDIWSNRYTAGTGWEAAELLESDDRGDGGVPQVSVDPAGNAMAVWWQFDGSTYNIQAAHYR